MGFGTNFLAVLRDGEEAVGRLLLRSPVVPVFRSCGNVGAEAVTEMADVDGAVAAMTSNIGADFVALDANRESLSILVS